VSEFHPLPTVGVEAHPPFAKSSLVVYAAAGVVPSLASRVRAEVKNKPNTVDDAANFTVVS
jgi:hypothetical protein